MEEQLISFETAKLAKEKGFNTTRGCSWYNRIGQLNGQIPMKEDGTVVFKGFDAYQPDTSVKVTKEEYEECSSHFYIAPTQSLLQKWLREDYKLHIVMDRVELGKEERPFFKRKDYEEGDLCWRTLIFDTEGDLALRMTGEIHKEYEVALEKGLQDALKLI